MRFATCLSSYNGHALIAFLALVVLALLKRRGRL